MHHIGLVGVGHWGPNIARSFALTGRAQIKWVCDLDPRRLERFADKQPGARTTQQLDDILADDEVAAVAVSTPVHTHFELVRQALEAGKHVMVEKPITKTAAEARALIELAEARQRVLMVGHVFEYNASIRALKKLIDAGELGDIHYLSFVRTNLGPVRTDVNALWDLASHDISIMTYLMGRPPLDVTARGQSYLNAQIEDAVFATFSFADGPLAHVNVSWLNPRKVRQITVVGSAKMAVWDDLELQRPVQVYDGHVEAPPDADTYLEYKTSVVDGGVYIPAIRLNQPLQAECEHFLDCVERGEPALTDGRNGLRVVQALEAATLSMASGSAVQPIPADD